MDIMYIDGRALLTVVEEGTKFSTSRLLDDVTTKKIWTTLIECRASIYTGLPNRIRVNQGTNLGSAFVRMAELHGVDIEYTGIESHNSLAVGSRYHQPLRQTFREIIVENPSDDRKLALAVSVKAMNDTLGSEGLVTSSLVFGEFPPQFKKSEIKQ